MKTYILVTKKLITLILNTILDSFATIAFLLYLLCPFVSMVVGQYVYQIRGHYRLGGEVFIPLVFFFVIAQLYGIAAHRNKSKNIIPRPKKRFTSVDKETGMVSIENSRLEELVLYMADMEDYLERKGLM